MELHRWHVRCAAAVTIAAGLLLLAGCQGLTGAGNGAGTVSVSSGNLNFGPVPVGTTRTLADTLANNTASSITISSIQGLGSGFQITGITLPLAVAAGKSVSFNVQFQPVDPGDPSASISFVGQNAQTYASLTASGNGVVVGNLVLTPAQVAFGNVVVGSNQSSLVTLANNGAADLTITQATMSGAGFSMSNLGLPLVLHMGNTASATITFAPPAGGSFSGNVTLATTSNGVSNSTVLSFLGAGVVPAGMLSPNPSSLSFGSIQAGSSSNLSETLTNTGGSSVTVSSAAASGTGFSLSGLTLPLTLAAGQSTSFTVAFSPAASGAVSGSVNVTSNGSNPNLTIALSGTGVAAGHLTANPASLAFGSVQVGNRTNLSETLSNTGGASVTISQANLTGAAFSVSGLTVPLTLAAGQSVTFTATFAPTSVGTASGSLSVVSGASNSPLGIALSGTGTAAGQLAVSPTSLSFGNVTVGSNAALSGSLNASGGSVTVSSASLTNSEFALSGISLPVTLVAGQAAAFTITFTPGAAGATSGTLSFSSNASNSPAAQTMTGTGASPTPHSVSLTWTAASGATGYNIYRGGVSGGPYTMINAALDSSTAYTDTTVVAGQTYYYVATAVDSGASESAYSNQAQAVIPTP